MSSITDTLRHYASIEKGYIEQNVQNFAERVKATFNHDKPTAAFTAFSAIILAATSFYGAGLGFVVPFLGAQLVPMAKDKLNESSRKTLDQAIEKFANHESVHKAIGLAVASGVLLVAYPSFFVTALIAGAVTYSYIHGRVPVPVLAENSKESTSQSQRKLRVETQ